MSSIMPPVVDVETLPDTLPAPPPSRWSQRAWKWVCVRLTRIFYRKPEIQGQENIPSDGPLLLAGNHVNALADAVVAQFACPRPIHPIARSGLFRSPIFRPVLRFIQAVPIKRRRPGAPPTDNSRAFEQIYNHLQDGSVILIFPEGQSHSDPSLRPLKTGLARIAQGFYERTGRHVPVVPMGLTFTHKGRFRADVLVQFGEPLELDEPPPANDDGASDQARAFTRRITRGLRQVTLNVDSWQDLLLMRLVQKFFAIRSEDGAYIHADTEHESLSHRFRSLKRLDKTYRALRHSRPQEVENLRHKLARFQRLCRRYGVRNYQLDLRYTPRVVATFLLRSLFFALTVFPLALWGAVSSALPYAATRSASRLASKGRDQYDTAGMLFGLAFFGIFWGLQTAWVGWAFDLRWAGVYALSLPLTAALALRVGHQRHRILEEIRIFFLFTRRRDLQELLKAKRHDLEVDLVRLARATAEAERRLARRLGTDNSLDDELEAPAPPDTNEEARFETATPPPTLPK